MGVLWTVLAPPVDAETAAWLSTLGVQVGDKQSRFPTGAEIRAVLQSLGGYDVEIFDNGVNARWQAHVTEKSGADPKWTLLNVTNFTGDERPQQLWFEKGHEELIVGILKLLTPRCGALILIDDAGPEPRLIE